MSRSLLTCFVLFSLICNGFCAYVVINSNAPVVVGGTVTFTAVLHDYNPLVFVNQVQFDWRDSGVPEHNRTFKTSNTSSIISDTWNCTYALPDYPPGEYNMEVRVYSYTLWIVPAYVTSVRISFNITETLNGNILFIQNNKTSENSLVSSTAPVLHYVKLKDTDLAYLTAEATEVVTYWFVDCIYYGPGNNFSLTTNYTDPDTQHQVQALVIAGYEPITTTAPSTTTTKATTTTTKPTTSTTVVPKNVTKREVNTKLEAQTGNRTSGIKVWMNGTLVPFNGSFPFVCYNNTTPADPAKTYGYFSSIVNVKAPVSKVVVKGDNWLLHGAMLNLSVKCQGSSMFSYCAAFYNGRHNVTGNETCDNPIQNQACEFYIQRYFKDAIDHTIVIIISNDINKYVYPVIVQVYEVQKQAQLSIIIVPVTFTLIAVVLIIFGVAYYVQNKSRFAVEVADFNFGQKYSDMEYMTFKERLRESIVNAFTRAPTPSSSEPTVWPPGGNQYGSMT